MNSENRQTQKVEEKTQKISDKMFMQSLLLTVLGLVMCLVMLCSTTFAWFSSASGSGQNKIQSATFNLTVSMTQGEGNGVAGANAIEPIVLNPKSGVSHYVLNAGTYAVLLTLGDGASAKGHCIVEIGGVRRHTVALIGDSTANKEGYEVNSPFTFHLVIAENETEVIFTPCWGIHIDPTIQANETYSSDAWQIATP